MRIAGLLARGLPEPGREMLFDAHTLEHLLRAWITDRAMRSVSHQMQGAKCPVHRDLAGFDADVIDWVLPNGAAEALVAKLPSEKREARSEKREAITENREPRRKERGARSQSHVIRMAAIAGSTTSTPAAAQSISLPPS